MQAVTHFVFAATLSAAALHRHGPSWRPASRVNRIFVAAIVAAATHVLLDDLALMSYHPEAPLPGDGFWLAFIAASGIAALAVAVRFRRHGWVLFASVLPDLDWAVARPFDLWEPGDLHAAFRSVPGIAAISDGIRTTLPDWRTWPWAAAGELLIVAILWFTAARLSKTKPL